MRPHEIGETTVNTDGTETVVLADGAVVVLRPLVPQDRELLVAGLAAMSAASRYYRFGTPVMPGDADVDDLLEVDGVDEVAIGAVSNPAEGGSVEGSSAEGRSAEGLGVARFLRDDQDPTVAEATVAVVDHWQGRGVGTRLLDRLVREARTRDVTTFRNYVLADNQRALRFLDALGADAPVRRGDVAVVDLPVPRAGQRLRESLTGRALLAAAVDDLRFAFRHPLRAAKQVEQGSRLGKARPAGGEQGAQDGLHPPDELSNPDLDAWLGLAGDERSEPDDER